MNVITMRFESADEVIKTICQDVPDEHHKTIANNIIDNFSGRGLYFPKSRMRYGNLRDEMLGRFFAGESRSVLCREYHISRSQLHRIIVQYHISQRVKCRI
ncbi:MAG: Mor transcription activator family protein [Desulfuromonadales bacterium]